MKVRQQVNLKETGERYLVTVMEVEMKLPQSYKILEIGAEFVVVEDFTGPNQIQIPYTSIEAVVNFMGREQK